MLKLRILIGVAALLGLSVASAADTSYRLAGIVTPENGGTLAIIEVPDGEQQLVRAGDLIEGGRVAEITANTVRLELSQGEVVLRLAGTDKREFNLAAYQQGEYTDVTTQHVDAVALRNISRLSSTAGDRKPKELASEVLSYLDLPAESRIMAINDQAVGSPAEAVQKMAANIDSKTSGSSGDGEGSQSPPFQFVISVAGEAGKRRIYIFSNVDGDLTFQRVVEN